MTERHEGLDRYRQKRDFARTPEPTGSETEDSSGPGAEARGADELRFVVQKHAARRLHYDLRLEWRGTLKSWAVPKGPSPDPDVRSLAVHVEDHPLEYADFEGVIPEGEYGGGTVMVWDRGSWIPLEDVDRGLARGRLKFRLHGERLRGGWILVRMDDGAADKGRNWLLRKVKHDNAAEGPRGGVRFDDQEVRSVKSRRTLGEIRESAEDGDPGGTGEGPIHSLPTTELPAPPLRATPASLPRDPRPQLPTLVRDAPRGEGWLHELKLDGYRIMARIDGTEVRLITRRGHDWTDRFPAVARSIAEVPWGSALVDGEVVVVAPDGTTDFQALQNILKGEGPGRLAYVAFDLMHYRGYDLSDLPLEERKELLRKALAGHSGGGVLKYCDHIVGHGPEVVRHACTHALEGIVAKRIHSRYRPGRHRSWVKVKCMNRQEFVVGGWTEPKGSRSGLGALLVGWYDEKSRLIYAGRIGTGFTGSMLDRLERLLAQHRAESPPFHGPPTGSAARGVHWVAPVLVVEVEYGSWTEAGILRHASFRGLREDKVAKEVTREMPVERKTEGTRMKKADAEAPQREPRTRGPVRVAGVRVTSPDRVLYPEQGVTKRDLARYYEAVGEWILPHLRSRPLTMVRCPRGTEGKCFYQKHLTEGIPEPVRGIQVGEGGEPDVYVTVADLAGLITLVQFGVLELHPWGSRGDRLDRPDRLVFDLDPGEGVRWKELVRAAVLLRDRISRIGLESFVRTTGGKGLHIVAPLVRRSGWEEVKAFARGIARSLARSEPDRFVATSAKAKRAGKIFVDYLRNGRGATAVASYSTRARRGAPVATPLRWEELSALADPHVYTVRTVPERLSRVERDPWDGFFALRQSLTKSMKDAADDVGR